MASLTGLVPKIVTVDFRKLEEIYVNFLNYNCTIRHTKEIIPKGNMVVLIVASSIGSIGNLALSYLPLYFTSLGGTVLQYGMIVTLSTLIGIPTTIAGGIISGPNNLKKIIIMTSWLGPSILLGYYFSNSWIVLSIPILIGAAGSIGSTASRQLVADATNHKNRTAQLSLYQTLTTLPSIIAPLAGGYLVHAMGTVEGFRMGVLISLALSPISIILLVKFLREKNAKSFNTKTQSPLLPDAKQKEPIVSMLHHSKDFWANLTTLPRRLLPLLAAFVLVIVANSTINPYLIFYGISIAKLDSFQWGIILSSQILFANIVRTPLGMISDKFDKKKVLLLSIVFTAPIPIFLIFMTSFWAILGILLVMIAAGVNYGPTHEALQIEITPREKRPALFATYDVLRNISVSTGTIIGAFLFTISYALPFYGFTILEACATAIIASSFFFRPRKPRSVTVQPE